MRDIKQIPEWEERLGVLLRNYGNASFDCGAYSGQSLGIYAKVESCASEAKRAVIDYARSLKSHTPTGIEAIVCADIAERQQKGIAKYGTTLYNNPAKLKEWLQHAYLECLDQALYLKRAIVEIEKNEAKPH